MTKKKAQPETCPCGSGLEYAVCCGALHAGAAAATPEALMRSRYAAYALGLEDYLLATWAPETRPERIFEPGEVPLKWVSLAVLASGETPGTEDEPDAGFVDFVARARSSRGAVKLAEHSRFRREKQGALAGRWFYVDGDIQE